MTIPTTISKYMAECIAKKTNPIVVADVGGQQIGMPTGPAPLEQD